jgi:hypothetical protein
MNKIFVLCVSAISVFVFGCSYLEEEISRPSTSSVVKDEQRSMAAQQSIFRQNQPVPTITHSVERDNLIRRTNLWNNPNKISYIYLLSENGIIMGFFPIQGKVSSVNSFLTPDLQVVDRATTFAQVVDAPDIDGTYGTNGSAIFFYLTDGTYMEWNGRYLLCDNPIKLTQQPIMTYDISEKRK